MNDKLEKPLDVDYYMAVNICKGCPQANSCPNVSICCGGQLTVNPVMPCPLGQWRFKESEIKEVAQKDKKSCNSCQTGL